MKSLSDRVFGDKLLVCKNVICLPYIVKKRSEIDEYDTKSMSASDNLCSEGSCTSDVDVGVLW